MNNLKQYSNNIFNQGYFLFIPTVFFFLERIISLGSGFLLGTKTGEGGIGSSVGGGLCSGTLGAVGPLGIGMSDAGIGSPGGSLCSGGTLVAVGPAGIGASAHQSATDEVGRQ